MEAAAPRSSGWMATLRQAAAIKESPQDWMARADPSGNAAGLASLDCASPAGKRTREEFERAEGACAPAASPSAALPPLVVASRGSFHSQDEAGSPLPSIKVARRLASPSLNSPMQAPWSSPALLLPSPLTQQHAGERPWKAQGPEQPGPAQEALAEERAEERADERAEECPAGDAAAEQGTVGQFLIELLRSHLVQTFSPSSAAQQLESMLTSSSNAEQRSEAELRQLRHVQNLIWDMMCFDADCSAPPTFASGPPEDSPEASCCSSSNQQQRRRRASQESEAQSQEP